MGYDLKFEDNLKKNDQITEPNIYRCHPMFAVLNSVYNKSKEMLSQSPSKA